MHGANAENERLVQSLIETGQLTPAQGQALLAETVRGGSESFKARLEQITAESQERAALQAPAPRGWKVGAAVGAYRLESRLGRGGVGEVWRATHVPTGAPRAIKTLLPLAEEEDRRRFVREAQALATLDGHPNVIRVHEVGQHDRRAFLVMDLARPDDLNQRLRAGPLPADQARELLASLASGLSHVHQHGLLHRDLKPHNVLFADDGRPLLSDFGLVRGPSRSSLSKTGEIMGTPAYMAPEQATGEPVDERTDVYGLGAILYHVLTGRTPFDARTPIAVLRQVVEELPKPPSKLVESVPAGLEQVCLRALAKDPNDRYPNARALRVAINQGETARSSRAVWIAPALIGAVAIGVAAFALAGPSSDEPRPERPSGKRASVHSSASGDTEELPPDPLLRFLKGLDKQAAEKHAYKDFQLSGFLDGSSEPARLKRVAEVLANQSEYPEVQEHTHYFYWRYAEEDADGWEDFADYLHQRGALLNLSLADRDTLAVRMLEVGARRGSRSCARRMGQLLENEDWGLKTDPDRVFAYYWQGRFRDFDPREFSLSEREEERSRHQQKINDHRHGTVRFVLNTPESAFKTPIDPERLLKLVRGACWIYKARKELGAKLGQTRYDLTRRVGATVFEDYKALAPAELPLDAIKAKYSDLAYLEDQPSSLLPVGQHLSKSGRPQEEIALAALCFLKAIDAGVPGAWSELAHHAHKWNALGSPVRREALKIHAYWLGAEHGEPRAIAHLSWHYLEWVVSDRQFGCELERAEAVFAKLKSLKQADDLTREQRIKLAYVATLLAKLKAKTPFSLEDSLSLLEQTVRDMPLDSKHALYAPAKALIKELRGG